MKHGRRACASQAAETLAHPLRFRGFYGGALKWKKDASNSNVVTAVRNSISAKMQRCMSKIVLKNRECERRREDCIVKQSSSKFAGRLHGNEQEAENNHRDTRVS